MNATVLNAKTQDKLDTVVLRDTCEDSTATVNGRQEYHGKRSCGAEHYCTKNLKGPEEDLVTSISWNAKDDLN